MNHFWTRVHPNELIDSRYLPPSVPALRYYTWVEVTVPKGTRLYEGLSNPKQAPFDFLAAEHIAYGHLPSASGMQITDGGILTKDAQRHFRRGELQLSELEKKFYDEKKGLSGALPERLEELEEWIATEFVSFDE